VRERKPDKKMDGKISRKDFIKIGFGFLLGGVAATLLGCKNQAYQTPRPDVPIPQYANFIGDPSSRIFHRLKCKLAPKREKAAFFDSPIAAMHQGFRPCRVCKPNKIN